jgi:hypothetical protein
MKLAEALVLRADAQKRFQQLKERLVQNALVQEGDTPAEDPRSLLEQLERVAADLTALIQRINRTNTSTIIEEGRSMADLLAARDVLGMRQALYRDLAKAAAVRRDRYGLTEIKFVSTISIAAMQRQADEIAQEYRALDTRIQQFNWQTDLLE